MGANVVGLGLTSMFTDISTEMVTAILPTYLALELGLGLGRVGLIDGLQNAVSALLRLAGGTFSDRRGRYKLTAAGGYGISTIAKLGLVLWGTAVAPFGASLLLDRVGKGLRTVPRDALISLSAHPRSLALAFAVHRAMDTLGALIGPLLAFAILAAAPTAYDAIFVASLAAGVVGLASITLLVREPGRGREGPEPADPTNEARALSAKLAEALGSRRLRRLLLVGPLLAIFSVGDALIYLIIQREANIDARYIPLLFAGTAVSYLLLALPAGRLADSYGRMRVYLAGHVLLVALYVLLAGIGGLGGWAVFAALGLLGAHYAMTDGVLMAAASTVIPPMWRGTGLAVLTTALLGARLVASTSFGTAVERFGSTPPLLILAAGLVGAVAISPSVLGGLEPHSPAASGAMPR